MVFLNFKSGRTIGLQVPLNCITPKKLLAAEISQLAGRESEGCGAWGLSGVGAGLYCYVGKLIMYDTRL